MIWTIWKNTRHNIRERVRDSGSIANNRRCFEVRATALRPRLHTEGFSLYVHSGPSTKGPPPSNYNSTLGVHYSSFKHNHLYIRGIGTKSKHNHLYTRGIRHKAKLKHNHLYTRGIGTKPKLNYNHLFTRGIGTKSKQRKDYNLGDPMITNNTWWSQ